MAQQVINNGTVAGDGTGENLFDAFEKVNTNFTEIYAALAQLQGNIPLNRTNFPSLLHAFTLSSISGNNLTDVVPEGNTPVLINSTGWETAESGGAGFRRGTSGTLSASGAWEAIGTKSALLIAVGEFPATVPSRILALGDTAAGPGLGIVGSGAALLSVGVRDAANYVTAGTLTSTLAWKAAASKLDQSTANGGFKSYALDVNGGQQTVAQASVTGDISASWGAFTTAGSGISIGSIQTITSFYYTGFYLLAFTPANFPSDSAVHTALAWMRDNPGKLWPGFLGIT